MQLDVPTLSDRGYGEHADVVDLDTGKTVGRVTSGNREYKGNQRFPSRSISLFEKKYIGQFNSNEECAAFAKGVEAVLNHMVSVGGEQRSQQGTAA